jgi:hypothetical protein
LSAAATAALWGRINLIWNRKDDQGQAGFADSAAPNIEATGGLRLIPGQVSAT